MKVERPDGPSQLNSQPFGRLLAEARRSTRSEHRGGTATNLEAGEVRVLSRVRIDSGRWRTAATPRVESPTPVTASRPEPVAPALPTTPQVEKLLNELNAAFSQLDANGLEPRPEARLADAVNAVRQIELFLKTQRPALVLTLNNSLGARVEIERLGPRRIALRLVGRGGLPSPEMVGSLREELRARGLRVDALSVA